MYVKEVSYGKTASWRMTHTQGAKIVAEAKFYFSCSRDKHCFSHCKNSRKCRKPGRNRSHYTLLHATAKNPAKPSPDGHIDNSKSIPGIGKTYTGQQQPSKTTTLFSDTDVSGPRQLMEVKLTNSSGTNTTAVVLCNTHGKFVDVR